MAWQGSDRRSRLPADWARLRKRVLRRDKEECQWRLPSGALCLRHATEVDHVKRGDDHRESNLRSLCSWHHAKKSAGEGAQAGHARRRQHAERFTRTEQHPGLL